ncbi:MAG: ferredoxin family protein [Dehalococcoidales bacterium]|nr:ferredoxin family protein [Dehalococcoidales bacterium]
MGLHNETKYIRVDRSKCQACWECVESCPNDVIGKISLPFHKHVHINNPDLCKGCLKCVKACLQKAIIPLEKV